MNQAGGLEAILARRSIRRYTSKPVSMKTVEMLIEAAMSAPSAGNEQPWHFIVISDPDILDRIPQHHPYAGMVPNAPVAILVCGDLTLDRHDGFWVQDCAAATQNLLIACSALGLGAVWLGCHPKKERVRGLQGLLKLPDHVIPVALVPIGHPAEKKGRSERTKEGRIHWEGW